MSKKATKEESVRCTKGVTQRALGNRALRDLVKPGAAKQHFVEEQQENLEKKEEKNRSIAWL